MTGRLKLLAMAFLALLAMAPVAAFASTTTASNSGTRASLPDIEDEVMCPTCGVALNQSFSPQAERERHFIRQQIALGQDKEQIKQALVREYGREVLATPRHSGFDLTAYVIPVAAIGLAAIAIAFALVRWRRKSPPADEAGPELPPADAARLERDLSRYEL